MNDEVQLSEINTQPRIKIQLFCDFVSNENLIKFKSILRRYLVHYTEKMLIFTLNKQFFLCF